MTLNVLQDGTFWNNVGILLWLLYGIGELMAAPRPRWHLDPDTLRNIRQHRRTAPEIHGPPPHEPAILGVLTLHIAFWSILLLRFPSPLYACASPAIVIAGGILVLVYLCQPYKRTSLFGPFIFFILIIVGGLCYILLKVPWSKVVAFARPLPPTSTAVFSELRPRPIENLPLVAFIQLLVLLAFGLTLTIRSPDLPEPVEAMILSDGQMWITSQRRHGRRARDQIFEVHNPNQLSSRTLDITEEEEMEMRRPKFVGYYGPKLHDHTLPGLVLITFGLTLLCASSMPAAGNRVLHASVPVHIITGAIAVRVSSIERSMDDGLRAAFRVVGILAMIYGVLLGKSLNNFSGLL